ncbi:MAG TPA: type II toxin-antitoxin system antitoxin SocA domain-containing protein [Thermoanaerobaculia bacterium]|nr:type II toxin-antitoxin system antitoxin SocA domain-containing protein [Thermoanaerobaculia bacterium]
MRRHPVFRAKKDPDLDVFSDSDIEALDYAIRNFGAKSAWQLSQDSHDEPAWKIANECRPAGSSVIMDYRLFFEGHPEAEGMLRLVEAQQEDRDSAEELATGRRLERELEGAIR